MKTFPYFRSAASALALFLAGCFGGEGDSPTYADSGNGSAMLKPGLYVGDYTPYDTSGRGWQSEFTLSEDGSFRFFWLLDNQPIGDIRGKWFQRDSSLHLNAVSETYLDQRQGFFVDPYPVENDTNTVRNVTKTSFMRKEWTLMRQKPYWITYTRRDLPRLGEGAYQYFTEVPIDATAKDTISIDIGLSGDGFAYKYKEHGKVFFEVDAKWAQIGSILLTYDNRTRGYLDSLQDFAPWDTLPGVLLQRVDSVSADGFHMWSPGGMSSPGTWDKYHKL